MSGKAVPFRPIAPLCEATPPNNIHKEGRQSLKNGAELNGKSETFRTSEGKALKYFFVTFNFQKNIISKS
jgi:hypothetical protein